MSRRKVGHIAQRLGVTLTVMLFAASVMSMFLRISYADWERTYALRGGGISVSHQGSGMRVLGWRIDLGWQGLCLWPRRDIFPLAWVWQFPLWMPLACLAATTIWLYRHPISSDRRCIRCDYDLTGLPAGSPCPECGAASRA